ncbi:MAG: protein kinase, partial [Deltaproteobacteria bacterium]|nr:protein kinase [Deltaproteobacteria bacterium]
MAMVCSNCEAVPAAGATSGSACISCGDRLIAVDTGDELVGKTIDGRFEVIAPLGRGGMGVVYRAKQLSIGREVAMKVLDRRIERDVAAVKRFFREAKLASTLQHPNTVPIIEFGQNADGRLFMVMELV